MVGGLPKVRWATWIPHGSWKDVFIGDYDYKYLFMPKWPYCRKDTTDRLPPFFAVNEPLPVLLALIMGLQHALAMTGGIVLGPIIVASSNPNVNITQYLTSVALMACGIGTFFHVVRFKIPFTRYYYGTGIVSVLGITTTQIVVGLNSISDLMAQGYSWNDAYGKFLGTNMVCSFATTLISFLPPKVLRKFFPTWIAGLTVFLVGVNLIGVAGISDWGGGCSLLNSTTGLPQNCTGNGQVELPFGSREYLGLGGLAFIFIILLETFGSPFARNSAIILAWLMAYAVSALVKKDGKPYVDMAAVNEAPAGTFFWVHTFKIGIFPGAILPFIIGYWADAATAVGDITATEEASGIEQRGPAHDERIQGCLLADGFNCFLASCATSPPVNVFAQNNGIIAFTLCASRMAGVATAMWLFLFGVLGKIGAFFANTPTCVIGGITTFLFGSIAISGIKVLMNEGIDRRRRFIATVACALGIGVIINPGWATDNLWVATDTMSSGVRAVRDSVILVMETGYVFGWLVAMVLNLIIPHETGDPMERIRAARKTKGLVVPLSEEEGHAIEENQIHNPKMGFEGDSAHPTPVVVPLDERRMPVNQSALGAVPANADYPGADYPPVA